MKKFRSALLKKDHVSHGFNLLLITFLYFFTASDSQMIRPSGKTVLFYIRSKKCICDLST